MPERNSAPSCVLWSPAAIPATCVAWNEPFSEGSNGDFAKRYTGLAGANVRWTITFGVVADLIPFG